MSENPTLTVHPGRSPALAALLIAAHLAALAAACLTLTKWWLLWPASIVMAVSLVDVLRVHAFRSARRAVVRVDLESDGAATVQFRNMAAVTGRLLGSSFVSFRLVILRIALPERVFPVSLVVEAGSLPESDFRRLRIWLRWRPPLPPTAAVLQTGSRLSEHNPPDG